MILWGDGLAIPHSTAFTMHPLLGPARSLDKEWECLHEANAASAQQLQEQSLKSERAIDKIWVGLFWKVYNLLWVLCLLAKYGIFCAACHRKPFALLIV